MNCWNIIAIILFSTIIFAGFTNFTFAAGCSLSQSGYLTGGSVSNCVYSTEDECDNDIDDLINSSEIGSCGSNCCEWCSCGEDCTYCCDNCINCYCEDGKQWDEFRCEATETCGSNILKRTCRTVYSGDTCCYTDESCKVVCDYPEVCKDCGTWQMCEPIGSCNGEKWSREKPKCVCEGECIDAIDGWSNGGEATYGARYYARPDYPKNECGPTGNEFNPDNFEDPDYPESPYMNLYNVTLPVKIDWDDVRGFKNGWCERGLIASCKDVCSVYCNCENVFNPLKTFPNDECNQTLGPDAPCYESSECVKSYVFEVYNITGIEMSGLSGAEAMMFFEPLACQTLNNTISAKNLAPMDGGELILDKSDVIEADPSDILINGLNGDLTRCFFRTNGTYAWKVKACCTSDGKECGEESCWAFDTNLAPEAYAPYDPDWIGPAYAELDEPTAKAEWCEMPADIYSVKIDKYDFTDKELDDEDLITTPQLIADRKIEIDSDRDGEIDSEVYGPFDWFDYYIPQPLWGPRIDWNNDGIYQNPETVQYLATSTAEGKPFFGLATSTFYDYGETDMNHTFEWNVLSCRQNYPNKCDNEMNDASLLSQTWKFHTGGTPNSLALPQLLFPDEIKENGFPVSFSWTNVEGARSYIIKIYDGGTEIAHRIVNSSGASFSPPETDFKLGETYSWKVKACWEDDGIDCGNWTDLKSFKIMDGKPEILKPTDGSADLYFPVTSEWTLVEGANSYACNLDNDSDIIEKLVPNNQHKFDFPDINLKQNYKLKVRACADSTGNYCADWSDNIEFETFELGKPENPYPAHNGNLLTSEDIVSWDPVPGAKFYQYTITNISLNDSDNACVEGAVIADKKIVEASKDYINLKCLGKYSLEAVACIDKDCLATGDPSVWEFSYIEPNAKSGGLVPCGRYTDNPETDWNERDKCEFKHFFLLLKNILDFIFWTLVPWMLFFLMLVSAITFYANMGRVDIHSRIKEIWKNAGKGIALIFFAWFIVHILLMLLGYDASVFGSWWNISF